MLIDFRDVQRDSERLGDTGEIPWVGGCFWIREMFGEIQEVTGVGEVCIISDSILNWKRLSKVEEITLVVSCFTSGIKLWML